MWLSHVSLIFESLACTFLFQLGFVSNVNVGSSLVIAVTSYQCGLRGAQLFLIAGLFGALHLASSSHRRGLRRQLLLSSHWCILSSWRSSTHLGASSSPPKLSPWTIASFVEAMMLLPPFFYEMLRFINRYCCSVLLLLGSCWPIFLVMLLL